MIATAAIPATNISLEDKATQPDQEAGFWDKPIKQPASGDSCAHHLQHLATPHLLSRLSNKTQVTRIYIPLVCFDEQVAVLACYLVFR